MSIFKVCNFGLHINHLGDNTIHNNKNHKKVAAIGFEPTTWDYLLFFPLSSENILRYYI